VPYVVKSRAKDGRVGSVLKSVAASDELAGPLSNGNRERHVVSFHDEEACRRQEAPLQQLARRHREAIDHDDGSADTRPAAPSSGVLDSILKGANQNKALERSSLEKWTQTPRWPAPRSPLLTRTPPAKPHELVRNAIQLRQLLSDSQGILYEDDKLTIEFSLGQQVGGRPRLTFTATLVNRSSHDLQQVDITTHEAPLHAYKLRIEREPECAPSGALRPQGRLRFRGEIEVLGVFEMMPEVELSYLLPDNLRCRATIFVPLNISRLMTPTKVSAKEFVDQWNSSESACAEVSFVCSMRNGLHGTSPAFECAKSLELGGAFQHVFGVSESAQAITIASSYPQRSGNPIEVLVLVELGCPSRVEASLCRVALRSISHTLNRALAHVLLYALSEPIGSP